MLRIILFSAAVCVWHVDAICKDPLDPLTSAEISQTSSEISKAFPKVPFIFILITLKEPAKASLLPYFLKDSSPPDCSIPREALTVLVHPDTGKTHEVVVKFSSDERTVPLIISWEELPLGIESSFSGDEMMAVGELALNDPTVKARLSHYKEYYSNKTIIIPDVWKYGFKGDKPDYRNRRMAQVYFYARPFEHDNFYVHPMGFVAVVDSLEKKVVEIEEIPIHTELNSVNRLGDEVPKITGNYDPAVSGVKYRTTLAPIEISQNGKRSFKISGNVLEWEKFKMRIGRNAREGIVLHHISYNDNGKFRPILYRASIAEIFVPYGDPRPPFHRKWAFDVGEYGLGFSASELRSPEDCRGSVYFMDFVNNDMKGRPSVLRNTICIHEEDAGMLWRKMDPISLRVVSVRSQRLVITFIATLSNYDYQFKWLFHQDASIKMEVGLTGIVSQNLFGDLGLPGPHATKIHPHVVAQAHQHFFVARLDTEIDGNNNTASVVDVYADSRPGSEANPYGNGFHGQETILQTPSSARTNVNVGTGRTWKISGDTTNINPITGTRRGWKLIPEHRSAKPFISQFSPLHERHAFTDYDVWVTLYKENQLYPGGYYLNNSGLPEWVAEDPVVDLVNKDIVLWHVFGVTHLVRTEDAPVMPVETVAFWFKPANFFEENPSLDVKPGAFDSINGKN